MPTTEQFSKRNIKETMPVNPYNAKTFVDQVKVNSKSIYFSSFKTNTFKHLRNMTSKNSEDVYRMSTMPLKEVLNIITEQLMKIHNDYMNPIYKNANPIDQKNHRSIVLLPIFDIFFELLIGK